MKLQTYKDLTDADLDRIERLLDAASAAPWFSYRVGRDPDAIANCIEVGACNELGSFKSMEVVGGTEADQDFIASARQDLSRLLLEVRILRDRLEEQRDAQSGSRRRALRGAGSSATALSA